MKTTMSDADQLAGLDFQPACESRGCDADATHLLTQTRPCCRSDAFSCWPCAERQRAYLARHLVLICRRHKHRWTPTPGCLTVRPIGGAS